MPLYEYHCEACGRRFEKIVKFSDPPLETCPTCGRGPVRKLMSSPAFHLKGTGWYATDYAKKDQASSGKTDSSQDGPAAKDGKEGKEGKDSKDSKDSKDKAETKSDATSDKSSTTDTSSSSAAAAPPATSKNSKSAS